ncbi:hypothetical protein SODALDRAFT_113220 [Sodiomyces alkalinus F11]|uniref:Uncharacterized protein n=1 Tax=Sodiomyces alkalinus (strain CBS 110278 / VKM F-3762 / F11) TaxID=1314773 RepID=A0A3N2Q338_SODAK|nr:hypothetical protein SODALDRAFT_113220 [Sodiomyces alkalinus F11]ROT41160.1 hypothetical protein SODALDRAFT_113220 [Sodiomyces alkalinus F11]
MEKITYGTGDILERMIAGLALGLQLRASLLFFFFLSFFLFLESMFEEGYPNAALASEEVASILYEYLPAGTGTWAPVCLWL